MLSKKIKISVIAAGVIIILAAVVVLLVVFLRKNEGNSYSSKDCLIYPFEVNLHPITVLANTSNFLYPIWGEKVLRFKGNQQVDFICPGRTILLGSLQTNNSLLTGTCKEGSLFKINNQFINWSDISCSGYFSRDIRATGNTCASNGQELEAGFVVKDGRFLQTLLICFNPALQIAYYTYIKQTASINQQVFGTPRPSWLQGSGIYSIGIVTKLYLRRTQRATINRLVGLPDNSTKYIQDKTNYFLARGHMTARSDNYYASQQNATFFMQNIAPQWQTFNGYNWNQIEIDVRDYASDKGLDLHVWSGVYGITTLPHEKTSLATELYLFVNDTAKLLPVPEIFWKLVYHSERKKGIVLIGVNNPFNSNFSPICTDVANQITWLHADRTNQALGFCYACRIATFGRVVTSIPNLVDRGLLL